MRSILYDFIDKRLQKKVFAAIHGGREVNSFEPWGEQSRIVNGRGQLYLSNLCYGEKYPNSFFDILYPDERTDVSRPTVVYFHGGGFLFGDKSDGDPLAIGKGGVSALLSEICSHGYNVVSANYAFAPEHRFPVQIHQANDLIRHLVEHPEYGLDMTRIVISGGSAGADITAIYGLALSNADYAAKLGITPPISEADVCALVIDEMSLNAANMSLGIKIMLSGWVGERNMLRGERSRLINVAANFGGKYPPSFLVASNVEPPFRLDEVEMYEKLRACGIACEEYYRPREEAGDLPHGFVSAFADNEYARKCFEKILAFVEKNVAKREGNEDE